MGLREQDTYLLIQIPNCEEFHPSCIHRDSSLQLVLTDHTGTTCDHRITKSIVLPILTVSSQVGGKATWDVKAHLQETHLKLCLNGEIVSSAVTEHGLSNPQSPHLQGNVSLQHSPLYPKFKHVTQPVSPCSLPCLQKKPKQNKRQTNKNPAASALNATGSQSRGISKTCCWRVIPKQT